MKAWRQRGLASARRPGWTGVLVVILVMGMAVGHPSQAPVAQLIDIKSTVTPARATLVWVNSKRITGTDPLNLNEGTVVKTGPHTQAVIAYFDTTAEKPTVRLSPGSYSTVKKRSFFIHSGLAYIKGLFNSWFNVESTSVKVGMTGTSFVLASTPTQEAQGPPRYTELLKLLARLGQLDAELAERQTTDLVVLDGSVAVSSQAGATIEASHYRVGEKVHFTGAEGQEQTVLSQDALAAVRDAAENGTLTVDEQGTLANEDSVILSDNYGNKWLRFANSNRNPAEALVGYWPLDEQEGAQLLDLSGYGTRQFNNGTPTAPVGEARGPKAVDGMIGGALEFQGNITRIKIPHHESMDVGISDYSVSAWIFIKRARNAPSMITKFEPDGGGFRLGLSDDRRPKRKVYFNPSSATSDSETCGDSLPLNTWLHLALVIEETAARVFNITCYVNGALAGGPLEKTTHTVAATDLPGDNLADFHIGQGFAGIIDEVAFFNKALSAAEVQALFTWRDP